RADRPEGESYGNGQRQLGVGLLKFLGDGGEREYDEKKVESVQRPAEETGEDRRAMPARSYCCHMTKILPLIVLGALSACAPAVTQRPETPAAPPVNTVETAIASDAVADSLLADVRALDSSIVVELRYATSNNFTGSPLPGYLANPAFLRREAAAALALVQRPLGLRVLRLRIF